MKQDLLTRKGKDTRSMNNLPSFRPNCTQTQFQYRNPVVESDNFPPGCVSTNEGNSWSALGAGTGAGSQARSIDRQPNVGLLEYNTPAVYGNLNELSVTPVENPDESPYYEHHTLEEVQPQRRSYDVGHNGAQCITTDDVEMNKQPEEQNTRQHHFSRVATELYTVSYLILFALLGTLARLGLQAITDYAGAPVTMDSVWPNFAGCVIMGFLVEDRKVFLFEWGVPTLENTIQEARRVCNKNEPCPNNFNGSSTNEFIDISAAKVAHVTVKKTIPLYIGLTTGFCGSFTSFSAFIRDMFLALSNSKPGYDTPRNGGYSFMAVMSVSIVSISLSLSGLFLGAHIAIMLESVTPSLPISFTRKVLDRSAVPLAWGCWIGAILLTVLPPDSDSAHIWRGRATFSLVFAPLGCLSRFYISLYLNGRIASIPLGTFLANVLGTAILCMSWDLAHAPLGGNIGCQVLQGIEDGYCGCLTTVSTWVSELASLKRRHAYVYGTMSILVALVCSIIIMGSMRWTIGFAALQCTH